MREVIGNCILQEWWLGFGETPDFQLTLLDMDACDASRRGVFPAPGSYRLLDGQGVEMRYTGVLEADFERETWEVLEQRTVVIVDVYSDLLGPYDDRYLYGERKLNTMGYALSATDDRAYHRREREQSHRPDSGEPAQDLQFSVDLSFEEPLAAVTALTPCRMTATLDVLHDPGDGTEPVHAVETFDLPCSIGPDPDHPWIRIWADGFDDNSWSEAWAEHFTEKGIFDAYPATVVNTMFEEFRPILHFAPEDPTRLFHDLSWAWYHEVLEPPPDELPPDL
jgi:hypothetical protein